MILISILAHLSSVCYLLHPYSQLKTYFSTAFKMTYEVFDKPMPSKLFKFTPSSSIPSHQKIPFQKDLDRKPPSGPSSTLAISYQKTTQVKMTQLSLMKNLLKCTLSQNRIKQMLSLSKQTSPLS